MANYYCSSRTNYFRVRDEAAFTAWAEKLRLTQVRNPNHEGRFALYPESEDGSFPAYDPEEDCEFDFLQELSKHLAEGEVAVMIEAGAEKLRYVTGVASAVNAAGESVAISLDEIYELAELRLGAKPTRAEY